MKYNVLDFKGSVNTTTTSMSSGVSSGFQYTLDWEDDSRWSAHGFSYHELRDNPIVQTDICLEVSSNLSRLQEMQSRLNFVMREIQYMMKA